MNFLFYHNAFVFGGISIASPISDIGNIGIDDKINIFICAASTTHIYQHILKKSSDLNLTIYI